MWTSLRVKTPGGPNLRGSPHYCEFYLLEFCQVLTVKTGEEFSSASIRGKGKGTILNYVRVLCDFGHIL